eukprot:Gb_30114 [translate_table: standard]
MLPYILEVYAQAGRSFSSGSGKTKAKESSAFWCTCSGAAFFCERESPGISIKELGNPEPKMITMKGQVGIYIPRHTSSQSIPSANGVLNAYLFPEGMGIYSVAHFLVID